MKKFPITAIREIKLLKALSHPNILQLREMAVERSKGEMEPSLDVRCGGPDVFDRRRTKETQHVHGHTVHGARLIRTAGESGCSIHRTTDQVLFDATPRRSPVLACGTSALISMEEFDLTSLP